MRITTALFVVAGLAASAFAQGSGQVSFHAGDKQNGGLAVEKVRLMHGKADGLRVAGANFQASSKANFTNFTRTDSGAWNPLNRKGFTWVNTGTSATPTRIDKAAFNDITSPVAGGTISLLGQGNDLLSFNSANGITKGAIFDNMAISRFGQVLIQEDQGNDDRLARLCTYNLTLDSMTQVGISDTGFFCDSAPLTPGVEALLTLNEKTDCFVDAWDILGPGWCAMNIQTHYGVASEHEHGGQLMAAFIPRTIPALAGVALFAAVGTLVARLRRR